MANGYGMVVGPVGGSAGIKSTHAPTPSGGGMGAFASQALIAGGVIQAGLGILAGYELKGAHKYEGQAAASLARAQRLAENRRAIQDAAYSFSASRAAQAASGVSAGVSPHVARILGRAKEIENANRALAQIDAFTAIANAQGRGQAAVASAYGSAERAVFRSIQVAQTGLGG